MRKLTLFFTAFILLHSLACGAQMDGYEAIRTRLITQYCLDTGFNIGDGMSVRFHIVKHNMVDPNADLHVDIAPFRVNSKKNKNISKFYKGRLGEPNEYRVTKSGI